MSPSRVFPFLALALLECSAFTSSFVPTNIKHRAAPTSLAVSIGLGPDKKEESDEKVELVPGVDYEVPDHESFRTARRTKLDVKCDKWFENLMQDQNGVLGELAEEARNKLITPANIVNEEQAPRENVEEWTPYVTTRLPWSPVYVAKGLEQFGLPMPRRSAETWRHFDVAGLVGQDYSTHVPGTGTVLELTDDDLADYTTKLKGNGGWLEDDECAARLVYVNGRYCPQLSKTGDISQNLETVDEENDELKDYLRRLTDGFTDKLAAPVPSGSTDTLTSFKKLSGPDHSLGDATSQFAINTQQGTACFAALNTMLTGGVAYVHPPAGFEDTSKPILVVNAVSSDGGIGAVLEEDKGVSLHPRTLVVAEEGSKFDVVQSCIDLDDPNGESHNAKLYNGYTQFFIKSSANVTHSYIDETGGLVKAGVERTDEAREEEIQRPSLKDTHLEALDVHIMGDDGHYDGTFIDIGGSGRIRATLSVSLLRPGSHAGVKGFALAGGMQHSDMKTNIHHVAQGTTSEQNQKNMIGGRGTGAFRGRIRVEQSAQQTDSQQLSRTILLSDKCKAWAVPSLEIIADDVQCTHGATVSDLSEEELFYLRSRGLSQSMSRNLLMYAFAGDVSSSVHPAILGAMDGDKGLRSRVIKRLENLVPQGNRAVKGEFQSV